MVKKDGFNNNATIPNSVMNEVMDMQQKNMRERKLPKQVQNDDDLWNDDDFEGSPNEDFDESEDFEEENETEDDDNDSGGHVSSGDLGKLQNMFSEMVDQQRQLSNNLASMELNVSNINNILKSSGQGASSEEIVKKLRDTLEAFSSSNLEQLDNKFSYFNQETIKHLFDQIDQRLRILNEREKSWKNVIDSVSEKLGKKVLIYSLSGSFVFSLLASVVFIVLQQFFVK